MISFPPCKINIGLNITGKRSDGYHNIQSLFYPVPLTDILEIIEVPEKASGTWQFSSSGIEIPGNPEQNLAVKAYLLLADRFQLPAVKIHLHKVIPMGAGLGGGSADGAHMLLLLNDKFELKLSENQLIGYAALLGSDCPFFILNKPALVSGRGEELNPVAALLKGQWLQLIYPGIHISTAEAFGALQLETMNPARSLHTVPALEQWKAQMSNDFEKPIGMKHPEIPKLISALYNSGAWFSAMSGSGSTVFGIFKEEPTPMALPENYFCFISPL